MGAGIQFKDGWMPDQVRHDAQKSNAFLNYDTVSCAGMTHGLHASVLNQNLDNISGTQY